MPESCQVDFYRLMNPALKVQTLACKLAMMAWERNHQVAVVVADKEQARAVDELMWHNPAGRFLPHDVRADQGATLKGIEITLMADLKPAEVLINLCPQPVASPGQFKRLLEIVPNDEHGLKASRDKFRHYRNLGCALQTHEITK